MLIWKEGSDNWVARVVVVVVEVLGSLVVGCIEEKCFVLEVS